MIREILNRIHDGDLVKSNIVSFKLDGQLNESLNLFCRDNLVKKSDVIRGALMEVLD